MIAMAEAIDVLFFSENSRNHEWEVNGFSSWVAKVDSLKSRSKLVQKKFGILSLSLIHIDGGGVDQFSSLVLDDLFDGGMVVADIYLTVIWLQVKITVALVVEEVLHVSLSNDEWGFVVGLIEIWKMSQPLGDNLLSVTSEWLGNMGSFWELEGWK